MPREALFDATGRLDGYSLAGLEGEAALAVHYSLEKREEKLRHNSRGANLYADHRRDAFNATRWR